jgi:Transcription termination factor nusG
MRLADEASGRSLLADPAFLALARAYESAAPAPRRATPRDAIEGHWYALALVPGAERKAIDRVADDVRVPLYLPMRREIRANWRGKRVKRRRALFTGYGFALIADVDELFGRITSCEGVRGIMCENGEPVIVRSGADDCAKDRSVLQRFDRDLIVFIQAIENGANEWLTAWLQQQQNELDREWLAAQSALPVKGKGNRRKTPHAKPPAVEIKGLDY